MRRLRRVPYAARIEPCNYIAATVNDSSAQLKKKGTAAHAAHFGEGCHRYAGKACCRVDIKHRVIINFCHWSPAYDANSPLKPGVAGKGAQFAKEVSGTKSRFNYTILRARCVARPLGRIRPPVSACICPKFS